MHKTIMVANNNYISNLSAIEEFKKFFWGYLFMLESELLKMFEYLFVLHNQTKKNKNCEWNVDEDFIEMNPTYFVISSYFGFNFYVCLHYHT
jgi:hypothetical protein